MEKTKKKSENKIRRSAFRNYIMLALSTILIILGAYFLVSLTLTTITKHKFRSALDSGNEKVASLHAGKISDKNADARDFLSAIDERLHFRRTFRTAEDVVGQGLHPASEQIEAAKGKAERLFDANDFAGAANSWSTGAKLYRKLLSQDVAVKLETIPPVSNALLRVYSNADTLLHKSSLSPEGNSIQALPGEYRLSIVHTNHSEWTTNILIETEREADLKITAKLPSLKGSLLISSTPPAEIWKGETLIGATGADIALPVGKHILTLRKSGYESKRLQIDMKPRAKEKVALKLEKQTGSLRVLVAFPDDYPASDEHLPKAGQISLNRQQFRETELPAKFSALPIGEYDIELRIDGCKRLPAKTAHVKPDALATISFEVQLDKVPVVFKVEPAKKASIFRNGKPIGSSGEKIMLLPKIVHNLKFVAEGYEDRNEEILLPIGNGSTNAIGIEMKKVKPYRLQEGTPRHEVLRWQGRPDKIRNYSYKYIYKYGQSEISFARKNDRVIDWTNTGENLKGLPAQ